MMHTAMILSATEMNGNKVRKLYKLFDTPASARIKKRTTVSLPLKGTSICNGLCYNCCV